MAKVKRSLTKEEEKLLRLMNLAQKALRSEPFTRNQFIMMGERNKINQMEETIKRLVLLRDKYKQERDYSRRDFEDLAKARDTLQQEYLNLKNDLENTKDASREWMTKAAESSESLKTLTRYVKELEERVSTLNEQVRLQEHAKTGLREILDYVLDRIQGPKEIETHS